MSKPQVLIFTETALAISETFIANHCGSLQRYDYTLVALYGAARHHTDVAVTTLYGVNKPGPLRRLLFRIGRDKSLGALIERLRPDIVHAHYLPNGVFMRPYAKRFGIPLVVTVHGHDATRQLRRSSFYDQIYRRGRAALIRDVALVLPVSDYLQQILLKAGFHPSRLKTHYLGVPMGSAPPIAVAQSPPSILFVGRLVAKKGIDIVLEAFAQVKLLRPDAALHIIGDGPLRSFVDKRAAAIGSVIVHGAQSPDATQQMMRQARMLVLPSRPAENGDVEGFGLVLAEAQGLGLPVVTSNVGGTVEAMVPDQTGFAIDPSNSTALAAACLRLLGDDALASAMGKRAYAHAREHLDLVKQTRTLEAIYDAVLARAAAP